MSVLRGLATIAVSLGSLTGLLGVVSGCRALDDRDGQINAPCTRGTDCDTGLLCIDGVCRPPDAGMPKDASSDG